MTASYLLTLAFAAFLLAGLAVKYWLASRQIRHVARHRNTVPPAFAEVVALAAHQKAADYTITKTRFGLIELAFGAAVLLGWTLLGGLDALAQRARVAFVAIELGHGAGALVRERVIAQGEALRGTELARQQDEARR